MSTDTTGKPRELLPLRAGKVRVFAPPTWLTRKFVILTLIGVFTVGPIPATFVITVADQWLRNIVDDRMSDPDIFNSMSLDREEYALLPLHWRQALAELSTRAATAELADVRELIRTLTPEQITLIDRIAPYAIDGFLVRDRGKPSNHPIPGLSLVHFATLEDLGIIQDVQRGYSTSDLPHDRPFVFRGTTAALQVQTSDQGNAVSLPVTRFTELGSTLIDLLRVPSDIRYFEWIAKQIDQDNVDLTIWATGARLDNVGRIHRETVAPWPDNELP